MAVNKRQQHQCGVVFSTCLVLMVTFSHLQVMSQSKSFQKSIIPLSGNDLTYR